MQLKRYLWTSAAILAMSTSGLAQSDSSAEDQSAEGSGDAPVYTQAELETLVAPVALYPDTLLMQILVATTAPLDVVKADNFLDANAGIDPAALKPDIEAHDWDISVEVLATAFPDVLQRMADNIDWTETMGDAMLVQSDDVMAAIQTMRQDAINSGALVSGEEQTVEVSQDEIIIQPTDPEVVYVPQYDQNSVFGDVGDALLTGAIIWGSFTIIDEIFDDDDDWNDYWGCRNCGGWNGQPIIRDPDIDIDIDGNVNIGNEIDIDRPDRDKDGGWRPDDKKRDDARDRIGDRVGDGEGGRLDRPVQTLPAMRSPQDDLRQSLSDRTGTRDITRPSTGRGDLPNVNRPTQATKRDKDQAVQRTRDADRSATSADRRASGAKAAPKKPTAKQKPKAGAKSGKKPDAMKRQGSGSKTKAASKRGSKKSNLIVP